MWLPRKGKLLLSQKMGEVAELGSAVTLSLIPWRRCDYLPGFSGNRFHSSLIKNKFFKSMLSG